MSINEETTESLIKQNRTLEHSNLFLLKKNKGLQKKYTCILDKYTSLVQLFPDDVHLDQLPIIDLEDNPIISKEEQHILVTWAIEMLPHLDKNGFQRFKKPFNLLPHVPELVYNIKKRIEERERTDDLDLSQFQEEPTLFNAIGVGFHGAQLHKHTDPNTPGFVHVRYNVYLQIPIVGGLPVYNKNIIHIRERNYVCCNSGTDEHYSLKVLGSIPRIILSYGYLVPNDKMKYILNKLVY
jgi:hypothetical protein